jgi:cell wall-associated NlpC family hydrolase
MLRILKIIILLFIWSEVFFMVQGSAYAQISTLKQGMTGDSVYLLQTKLQEFGFYSGELDANFGLDTVSAVIKFQQACNLEPDGIVGEQTFSFLHQYASGNASSRGQVSRGKGKDIGAFAQKFYGTPYLWAGSSPSGFDCSGFVYYIFNHFGIFIPRMADEQFQIGLAVNPSELQVGDLVFFSTYEPGPSHTGIYIGNDQFIHASSAAGKVTITALSKPYYQTRYLGARRII